jgi:hypothetical protein
VGAENNSLLYDLSALVAGMFHWRTRLREIKEKALLEVWQKVSSGAVLGQSYRSETKACFPSFEAKRRAH